ncbi:hypothetical protein [uncultured Enterovirga sp.]|uniref:hypothetical protein n=1 Tax=uncultured Enterovirga sp. TaxID=2026352 RepID=UPI0035CBCCF6
MISANATSLRPAGALFGHFEMIVPPGVSLGDLLERAYWQNAAPKLQVNTAIRVVAPDGSFDALLAVSAVENRQSQHHWAEMRVLWSWIAEAADREAAQSERQ